MNKENIALLSAVYLKPTIPDFEQELDKCANKLKMTAEEKSALKKILSQWRIDEFTEISPVLCDHYYWRMELTVGYSGMIGEGYYKLQLGAIVNIGNHRLKIFHCGVNNLFFIHSSIHRRIKTSFENPEVRAGRQ